MSVTFATLRWAVSVLRVRRFRCQNPACPAVTFPEQVQGLNRPHSRFTPLPLGLLARIGLALAGRAGAWLTAVLGVATGRDTLLRLVKALPKPEVGAVEVLGVDDFSFRKGRHHGTVLVDMASHRPLHLFDGREGEDLAAWLRQHPEVRVICRDRSSGYGEGSHQGAPQAVQVADRYHLWQNLCQAVEKAVNTLRPQMAEPAPQPEPDGLEAEPDIIKPRPGLRIVARFEDQRAAAHELWAQGLSKAAIGRELGLHQATVRKLVNAAAVEELTAKTPQRAHPVDPYTGDLHRRWKRGRPQRSPALPGDPAARLPRRRTGGPTAPATLPDRSRTHAGTRPQATVDPRGHRLDHHKPTAPTRTTSPSHGPATRISTASPDTSGPSQ
ncbi:MULTISPECIES: transposase [Streptomyces]|uniref:transposase n=1 Tax=Streptomyces TaxID=1883 RepID=UPI00193AC8F4|nr:transposase [Streptomyces albidoflavus]